MIKIKRYLPVLLPALLALSLAVLVLTVFFGVFFQNAMINEAYRQQLLLLESSAHAWDTRYRALTWSAAHTDVPDDLLAAEKAVGSVSLSQTYDPSMPGAVPEGMLSLSVTRADGQVWYVWIDPQLMIPAMQQDARTLSVLPIGVLSSLIPQSQRMSAAAQALADGGSMLITDPDGEKLLCVWPLEAPGMVLTSLQSVAAMEARFSSILGSMVTLALIIFVISALASMLFTYRPFKSLVKTNEILAASGEDARVQLTRRFLWEICTGTRSAAEADGLDLCRSFPRLLLEQASMLMFLTDEGPGNAEPAPEVCASRCKELMREASALLAMPHFLFAAPDGRRVILLRAPLDKAEFASLPAWKAQLEARTFPFTLLCAAFSVDAGDLSDAFDILRAAGKERFLLGMGWLQIVGRISREPAIPEFVSLQEQLEKLRRPLEKGNPDCGAAYIALLQRYRASYIEYQAALLHVCNFLNQERLLLKNMRRHAELPDALITTGCRTSAEAESAVADYVDKLSECWSFIDKNRIENYLRAVDDLIDQNFSDPTFGVTQIAEHLNLTPSYASKLYKDASGIILIDRLSAKRSETAEYLLSQTKVPLSNIYRMAGYGSNNYFYRVFRKRHGITPLEYRNQVKAGIKHEA